MLKVDLDTGDDGQKTLNESFFLFFFVFFFFLKNIEDATHATLVYFTFFFK